MGFRSSTEAIDTTTPAGRMMMQTNNLVGATPLNSGSDAYTIAGPTSEIGIRIALGATRGNLLGVTIAFQVPGLPAKVATPASIAALAILMITLVAAYIPARRAAHIEPLRALRYE